MDETKALIEKAISDGGMSFVSGCPDLYSIGQRDFMHICMPDTGERHAGMECMEKVIQMYQFSVGQESGQRL